MATSGTVSQTSYPTQKLIDQAFRLCKLTPQQVTAEHLETALEILYTYLSTLANKGIPLWCVARHLLGIYESTYTVSTPSGTVDVMNANLRQVSRLSGTYTSSEGTAEYAFDGDLSTSCTEVATAGWIQLELDSATIPTCFGIMPNATGTWSISVQTSDDGVTWTTRYTDAAFDAVSGVWQWFDIEGIPSVSYVRLQANGSTVLNVVEFVVANTPLAIPLASINRDDYSNLPNRTFQGRPVQYMYNKKITTELLLWPVPSSSYAFYQLELWTKRYVQDVGTMVQDLEIPQSWIWAVTLVLAHRCALVIKEVHPERAAELKPEMEDALSDAWAGQTDSAPTFIYPNISPYTR